MLVGSTCATSSWLWFSAVLCGQYQLKASEVNAQPVVAPYVHVLLPEPHVLLGDVSHAFSVV